MPRARIIGLIRPVAVALAVVLATGVSLAPPSVRPVAAAVLSVRLEAGTHTGYRFSSTGTTVDRKGTTLPAPANVAADRRRSVPNRSGMWLRLTTGPLAGWEVRESMVAHVRGKVGESAYAPPATITFGPGRYLGYTFTSTFDLATTRRGTTTSAITALADRQAVINGRAYVHMNTGPWRGYWIPVPAAAYRTASRITCTVSTKVPAGTSVVYRRVSTTDREIALTFDLGGRTTPARAIVERLVIDRVCATIFPSGDTAGTAEGRDVLALIKAHPELFEVGNHTQNHCNLRDGGGPAGCPATPPTTARIRSELLDAEAAIRAQVGKGGAPYWRPPYGAYDSRVTSAAASVGFTKTIMWDIDTIDWRTISDGGPTAASMTAKVAANARTGSIVLMHLGGWHTYDALPSMIQRLRAVSLEPTTISALLRAS